MRQEKIFRKNPNMVTRTIDDETILLPIIKTSEEINCIYTLNKPAARVWELINGKRTAGDICTTVMKEYRGTEKEVTRKLAAMFDDLEKIEAVTAVGTNTKK